MLQTLYFQLSSLHLQRQAFLFTSIFSKAMAFPFSTKFNVARSTASTSTLALFDFPFFLIVLSDDSKVVTCTTNGSKACSTERVLISNSFGFQTNLISESDIL
eukprot:TRINITY_DN34012_c0_g1_i1.p1 TRINITY_DN34012_c0_g1~~TRINITY_DN34012_c0_g1_i1.p1  ORF type:complete len:103 (+),score=6.36 TRINITY_DN34012_c0_g1_i1:41-349(+)